MQEYRFIILEEPQGKGRPRFTKAGHAYTPDKTRQYERFVAMHYHGKMFEGAVAVSINAYFKKPMRFKGAGAWPTKRPDADNIAKAILDGLNGKAWKDDKQVVELHVTKAWAEKHEQVEITIRSLE